jgi:ubiquinol-cytochrome c reductase cytochrome b subunit
VAQRQQQTDSSQRNIVSKLYHWFVDGLDRTVFRGIQYTFPRRFVSPLGYLGVLTGITFLVLGVTGGLLMIYYQPSLSSCSGIICAFSSVANINDNVFAGFLLRNIHYTASNAMVLLAVLHMYYQYFSGRFKIKNEVLWVTGIILGIITGVEAYTGYDLIFNQRAGLAIEIGSTLTGASPLIGPALKLATFGSGFADFVLRLYAAHVFILPMVMLLIVFIHFPRYLVLDLPIVATVVGGLFMIAAVFPVQLGTPYDPTSGAITIPEWYVDGLYALLRTFYDRFVMGGLMPALFFLMALVIPFVDTSKKLNWRDRPFFAALGVASIGQVVVTTAWGFYVSPDYTLPTVQRLLVPPDAYFGSMVGITIASFVLTYAFLRYIKARERVRKAASPLGPMLNAKWTYVVFLLLIFVQVALVGLAILAMTPAPAGLPASALPPPGTALRNMVLFDVGAIFVTFGVLIHLYRYGQNLPF